ncbi:MAG: VanZ family protein [Finegoldia sp.]|nr:VanZ family protein [Finegoldia sp.]
MKRLKNKKIIAFAFFYYLIFCLWILLFKMSLDLEAVGSVRLFNLIPFGLAGTFSTRMLIEDFIYNILAFIPFGIFIKSLRRDKSLKNNLLVGFLFSIFIEVSQYLLAVGVSDGTDLTANSLGALLGIFIYDLFSKKFSEKWVDKIIGEVLFPLGFLLSLLLIYYKI